MGWIEVRRGGCGVAEERGGGVDALEGRTEGMQRWMWWSRGIIGWSCGWGGGIQRWMWWRDGDVVWDAEVDVLEGRNVGEFRRCGGRDVIEGWDERGKT